MRSGPGARFVSPGGVGTPLGDVVGQGVLVHDLEVSEVPLEVTLRGDGGGKPDGAERQRPRPRTHDDSHRGSNLDFKGPQLYAMGNGSLVPGCRYVWKADSSSFSTTIFMNVSFKVSVRFQYKPTLMNND